MLKLITMVLGGSAVSWLTSNLAMLGIAAAVMLVTNLGTGIGFYIKGYNSAADKCKVASVARERDEARRDLRVQQQVADDATKQLAALQQREQARNTKELEDAQTTKPLEGCVVGPSAPVPAIRGRVRHKPRPQ